MTDQTVADVLNKAADLIEERGWATGNCGMKVEGPMCLEGALAATLGTPTDVWDGYSPDPNDPQHGDEFYQYGYELTESPAYKAIEAHLSLHDSLWTWNDEGGRTADEVIETLRAAAIIAAAQEVDVRVVAPGAELVRS